MNEKPPVVWVFPTYKGMLLPESHRQRQQQHLTKLKRQRDKQALTSAPPALF